MLEADFHPLVAEWLKANGFQYHHEAQMPEYGRADFKAIHLETNHVVIVECKANQDAVNSPRSFLQLMDYCRQIPDSQGIYAIPKQYTHPRIEQLCEDYHLQLLAIEVPLDVLNKPSPVNPLYLERARTIKDTALRLINQQGYLPASLRQIAKEMQIAPPSIYHYFETADVLTSVLIEETFQRLLDDLQETHNPIFTMTEQLQSTASKYRIFALQNRVMFQYMFTIPPNRAFPLLDTSLYTQQIPHIFVDIILHYQPSPVGNIGLDFMPSDDSQMRFATYWANIFWSEIHGLVMLELQGYLPYFVGDIKAFYDKKLDSLIWQLLSSNMRN